MRIIITEKQFRKILKRELAFTLAKLGYQMGGKKIAHHKSPSTDNTHNWKDFWQEKQPLRSFPSRGQICPSCLLKKTIFVGGHVIIEDQTYIVPVCDECNKEFKGSKADEHFFYVNELDMVPAPED